MDTDNLIPRNLFTQKLLIWKNFSVWDFLYGIFSILLAAVIIFPIHNLDIAFRITFFVIVCCCFLLLLIYIPSKELRIYQIVILFFKFLITKKKYKIKDFSNYLKSQSKKQKNFYSNLEFLNIENDALHCKDKTLNKKFYMSAIEIKGINFNALNIEEQDLKRALLKEIIRNIEESFTLIKVDEKISFHEQANYINDLISKLNSNVFIKSDVQRKHYDYQLKNIFNWYTKATDNVDYLYKKWYLVCYADNLNKLANIKQHIHNEFRKLFFTRDIDARKLVNILKNIFNPIESDVNLEQITTEGLQNIIINNIISNLNFKSSSFVSNDNYYNISTLADLPPTANYSWLDYISDTGSTVIINSSEISSDLAKRTLQKTMNNVEFMYINKSEYKEAVNKEEVRHQLDVLEEIKDNIAHSIEKLRNYNIVFLSYGSDAKNLQKNIGYLNEAIKDQNMKLNTLTFLQKEMFYSIFPKYNSKMYRYGIQLPSMTFASSFPFQNSLFIDNKGLYLGDNNLSNPVVLDIWNRENNRLNSNALVLGTSGGGKSVFTKKMILNQIILGSYVFVIDPERDYTYLAKYLKGQILNMSDGTKNRINPLQVLLNEENDTNNLNPKDTITNNLISEHLKLLETWLTNLFMDANNEYCKFNATQMFYIMREIKSLYISFGLYKKNLFQLKPTEFPIINDLIIQIKKKLDRKNLITEEKHDYRYIFEQLRENFTNGGMFQNMYNGYSNLKIGETQLVVFDVKNLLESKHVPSKNAQLMLMIGFIESEINRNAYSQTRERKHAMLVLDEAHLFFNENNLIVLEYIASAARRFRKRQALLYLATQSGSDFDATDKIRTLTKGILQNIQYTFAFSSKPSDVNSIANIFKIAGDELTENEKLWISMGMKGRCLFINGYKDRQILDIKIFENEWKAFGKEVDEKYIEE